MWKIYNKIHKIFRSSFKKPADILFYFPLSLPFLDVLCWEVLVMMAYTQFTVCFHLLGFFVNYTQEWVSLWHFHTCVQCTQVTFSRHRPLCAPFLLIRLLLFPVSVCVPVSLIRAAHRTLAKGLLQNHGHLTHDYAPEETAFVSPSNNQVPVNP